MNQSPLTYQHLLEKQDYLVETGQVKKQTAANRATALRAFLRLHHVDVEDVVGSEMRMHWPDCLERFIRSLQEQEKPPRDISNTRSALMPWRQMVVEDDNARAFDAGKPTLFQTQLKALMGEHPVKRVARNTRVPYDMLLGWMHGKLPRAANAPCIARLEVYFGIQSGSLASIAGVSHTARLRPADLGSPTPNAYRASLAEKTKVPYWLRPPEESPLRQQWLEFMRYKTDPVPVLERSSKGKWRFAPLPLGTERATNWFEYLDGAEVPSAYAVWAKVAGFLGWLTLPNEKGGMGKHPEEVQTMAWLVVPELVAKNLEWKKKRAGKHTTATTEFLGWAMSLMRAVEGYFPQNEWLRETLPEEYRGADWAAMCATQMKYLGRLVKSLKGEVEVSRDSFAPISDIVNLAEPMEAVVDMFHRMRADRPVGHPVKEAIWARDMVMMKLLTSNPLRKRMYCHLQWRPDNTGQLYQKFDGSWWIKWKTRYFKNALGAARDQDYDSPVHAFAWADIERYLMKHRAALMKCPTDFVLLSDNQYSSPGEPHKPWADIDVRVRTLTRRYLWRCDGIGPHAFRHIVGTSIIKAAPGEMLTVAKVLNDRVATVEKHYARFNSGDGARRMGDLLGKSLNRM